MDTNESVREGRMDGGNGSGGKWGGGCHTESRLPGAGTAVPVATEDHSGQATNLGQMTVEMSELLVDDPC